MGVYIRQPLLAVMYIIVGLSALLVSANRALRRPSERGTGTDGSTFLFCICFISPYILIKNLASLEPRCSKRMNNMKTMKRFLALLLFFVAAMNVQNLSAQTNGDVNNDGNVNEADISAIIEIMKEANGVGPKKYYWYVGQENPASIDTSKEGWTELGSDLSKITFIQADTSNNPDYTFPNWYVVIPTSLGFKPYNSDGSKDESAGWTSSNSKINGYTVWMAEGLSDINSRFQK